MSNQTLAERDILLRGGRISFWPVGVAIGFPLLLTAIYSTSLCFNPIFPFLLFPIFLIAWAGAGVWAAILTVKSLRRHSWRQAAIRALLPVLVVVVALQFRAFLGCCMDAGDVLNFFARRKSYIETVRAMPSHGEPRLIEIVLGGRGGWAVRGFIYDESDEITRESPLQSPDWKARAQR